MSSQSSLVFVVALFIFDKCCLHVTVGLSLIVFLGIDLLDLWKPGVSSLNNYVTFKYEDKLNHLCYTYILVFNLKLVYMERNDFI